MADDLPAGAGDLHGDIIGLMRLHGYYDTSFTNDLVAMFRDRISKVVGNLPAKTTVHQDVIAASHDFLVGEVERLAEHYEKVLAAGDPVPFLRRVAARLRAALEGSRAD